MPLNCILEVRNKIKAKRKKGFKKTQKVLDAFSGFFFIEWQFKAAMMLV